MAPDLEEDLIAKALGPLIDCSLVKDSVTFLLNDTHIGFKLPMYKITFQPMIDAGVNISFTNGAGIHGENSALDYVRIEKIVNNLFEKHIYYNHAEEPTSLQTICMEALNDFT